MENCLPLLYGLFGKREMYDFFANVYFKKYLSAIHMIMHFKEIYLWQMS